MYCLSAVVVAVVVAMTNAYPNGAPTLQMNMMMNSMCTTGNMRPGHTRNGQFYMPQNTPAPFTLTVDNANIPYKTGSKVRVTLTAKPGKSFKGFFITGDGEDAPAGLQGTFEAALGTQAKPARFCRQGITHTNNLTKTAVTVLWSPNVNYTHGKIQFKATVVESFERFYTGVLSNTVNADPMVDTQSQFVQKQMQQMMGQINRGNGQAGGMFGGVNFQRLMNNMRTQMGTQAGSQAGGIMGVMGGGGGFQG
ncbi:putative defense protein 3 isoform X1 [Littorina saxatilis]|uniref:Reelin domain-containing protein n=1 Tax=Littorina saxatilis TaxID=31220 RepID=A0AAN9ATX8_9CAEN